MCSLENYIIGDNTQVEDFIRLSKMAKNLDKADFIDVGYIVDETMYPKPGHKEGQSSQRVTRARSASVTQQGTENPQVVKISDSDDDSDDDEDDEDFNPHLTQTPRTGHDSSALPIPSDNTRETSETSFPEKSPISSRGKRKMKEESKTDLASKLFSDLSERMLELEERQTKRFLEARERDREEREREREEREREGAGSRAGSEGVRDADGAHV